MALEDWLLKSGMRTDEQVADLHSEVFSHEWDLPYDSALGMLCMTTFQEVATQVHYANLRRVVQREGGCPALEQALLFVAVDEAAHADFFRRLLTLYLEHDRPATLEQIRHVANTFRMPAVYMLADSRKRVNEVRDLDVFNESIFYGSVVEPILRKLGVTRRELRQRRPRETVMPLGFTNMKP